MIMKNKIKILLADDHKILRHGLKKSLEGENDMIVSSEAENGRAAIKLAERFRPDLVIMDINMPDLNGMESTKQIISDNPDIKVIALSMHSDRHYVMGMLKAGASGFLLKTSSFEELSYAIRSVASGKTYLSPDITGIIVESAITSLKNDHTTLFSKLTTREREILQLITEGMKSTDIANHLNISKKTVDTHRCHLMSKLKLKTVAELTKYAIREGITSLC